MSSSSKAKQFKLDNILFNEFSMQSAIQQSSNKINTLSNAFRFCQLKNLYQIDPLNKATKNQMKDLIVNKFQTNTSLNSQVQKIKSQMLDLKKVFPLNKPGNFGRTLERKCKIVPKGVLQFQIQASSQAKIKEVKSFRSIIQRKSSSSGNNSLSWHSQEKNYPYRIILIDNNGNNKGIYFQSQQQAQKARVYFCSIYKSKKISQKVIKALQQKVSLQYWFNFKNYLISIQSQNKKLQTSILRTVQISMEKSQYNQSIKESNIKPLSTQKSKLRKQYPQQENNSKSKVQIGKFEVTQRQNTFILTQSAVRPATQYKKPQSNVNQFKSNIQFVSQKKQSTKMNPTQNQQYLSTLQKNLQKKSQKRGYLDELFKIHETNQIKKPNKIELQQSNLSPNNKSLNESNLSLSQEDQKTFSDLNFAYVKKTFLNWSQKAQEKNRKNSVNKSLFNTNKYNFQNPSNLKTSQVIQQEQGLPQLTGQMLISKPNQKISKFEPFLNNSNFLSSNRYNNSNSIIDSRLKQSATKNNQQSRYQSRVQKSRKQQSIFPNEKIQTIQKSKPQSIQRYFESIQLLGINSSKQSDNLLFLKPIVTAKLIKKVQVKNKLSQSKLKKEFTYQLVQDYLFNTVLLKLHPHPEYQLVSADNVIFPNIAQQKASDYILQVETIDFLTNKQISLCEVNLQALQIDPNLTSLMDVEHNIRLYIKNNKKRQNEKNAQKKWNGSNSMHLQLPPINKEIIIKIKAFWQKEAISKSYYNMQDDFSLYDAVSNSYQQAQPLSWWLNLTQLEYTYLCILQSASKILNYRLVEPMLFLIRSIIQINYKIQQSVQILLSILMNFGKYYYFPDQIGIANYLHVRLGIKGEIGFQNRVASENILFKTILKLQMPSLFDKLSTKNVHLSHLMMQYTYELFSRNFQTDKLIEIWNFSHQNGDQVPLYFFLLTIGLCQFYQQKLIKCKRLKEAIAIFQSRQIQSLHSIKKYVNDLKNKYFYGSKNFFDQLKEVFRQKPLQRFSQFIVKRDQQQKQLMKQERITIKKKFCKALISSNESIFQLSQNLSQNNVKRKYILHIYFYKLPEQSGNLTLKEGQSEYECIAFQKNRYFIIGEVKSEILMKFVDFKGNQYKNTLTFNLGVNQFKVKLRCDKIKKQHQVQYLCGLLTEAQIQILKTNKKSNHFFGPFIQKQSVNQQLLKAINQIRYLMNQNNIKSQDSLINIKALFGFGQKQFNQIQFYLYKICCKSTTLIQKIVQMQKLSSYASKSLYLCDNKAIFKTLIQKFLKINQFQIKQTQFYCYFNDSLESQFDAPKILKCRFYYQQKELKLQKQLIRYQCQKGYKYLYEDIICQEILNLIKPLLIQNFGIIVSGDLKILYSSSGQICIRNLKLIVKGKQLVIDDSSSSAGDSFQNSIFHDISQKEPQLLMTEVLPSFTKISTILDYVNTKKNVDLRLKSQEQQKKVIPQDINLLKYCQKKFKKCILLRYEKYPTTQLYIPFLNYFHQLTTEIKPLKYRFYYLNNMRDSIKSICTSKSNIKYSGNHKDQQQLDFIVQLGLYGNLRKFAAQKSQTIYFWTYNKDDHLVKDSLVNINYGHGINRWEKCKIKEYRKASKVRYGQSKNAPAQSKIKIQYLIQYKDKLFMGRDYEVKISQKARQQLIQMQKNESLRKESLDKSDIISGLQHLIGFMVKKG